MEDRQSRNEGELRTESRGRTFESKESRQWQRLMIREGNGRAYRPKGTRRRERECILGVVDFKPAAQVGQAEGI
jgi:hypothetical protein